MFGLWLTELGFLCELSADMIDARGSIAAGGATLSSETNSQLSGEHTDLSSSSFILDKNCDLVRYFKANKSNLSWSGTFQEFLAFSDAMFTGQAGYPSHHFLMVRLFLFLKWLISKSIIFFYFCLKHP